MRIALLALLVVGCGDDHDAGDAMGEAPEQPVGIRVTRQSVPLPDLAVIFQRADASVVLSTTTDADGHAEAIVGAGGFVSAVTPFAGANDVKTFAGVTPGDQLVIDGVPDAATPMTAYTVRVNAVAGAQSYRVGVRCLVGTGETFPGAGNPIDLPVTTTCLAPTETLVTALDNFGFPLESVFGAEATPTEGSVVDLTNEPSVSAETATITLANAPAQSLLEASRAVSSADPARAAGRVLFLAETEPATNGAHPIVFPDVAGARQTIAITGTLTGARPVFVWGDAGSATVDVGTLQAAAINTPTLDRNTSTVSWMGGADASFAFGQLFVDTGSGNGFLWSYAGPIAPGTTSFVLPPLEGFSFATATRIDLELGVARIEGVGVIDELRRDGAWLDANNGIMGRQQVLFRAPTAPGSVGLAYVGGSLTF